MMQPLSITLAQRLGDFDLQVQIETPPGVTVLFGPSGAGKTALLQAVAGLTQPDRGRIALPSGKLLYDSAARLSLPPQRRRLGVIFQQPRLFPHLSVRGNLTYGQRFAPPGARLPALADVVALLEIGHLLHRRPQALSGGEAARVAMGRALLCGPEMILADEPLSALDLGLRAQILPYLQSLRDLAQIPMLYVTHALDEVAALATSVVALRQGRVIAQGPPAQVLARADALGGPLALLPARRIVRHADGLAEYASDFGRLWVPEAHATPPARTVLRIRAQDVTLALAPPGPISALNILRGQIAQIAPMADAGTVLIALAPLASPAPDAARLLAQVTQRSASVMALRPGQEVFAIVKSVALSPAAGG